MYLTRPALLLATIFHIYICHGANLDKLYTQILEKYTHLTITDLSPPRNQSEARNLNVTRSVSSIMDRSDVNFYCDYVMFTAHDDKSLFHELDRRQYAYAKARSHSEHPCFFVFSYAHNVRSEDLHIPREVAAEWKRRTTKNPLLLTIRYKAALILLAWEHFGKLHSAHKDLWYFYFDADSIITNKDMSVRSLVSRIEAAQSHEPGMTHICKLFDKHKNKSQSDLILPDDFDDHDDEREDEEDTGDLHDSNQFPPNDSQPSDLEAQTANLQFNADKIENSNDLTVQNGASTVKNGNSAAENGEFAAKSDDVSADRVNLPAKIDEGVNSRSPNSTLASDDNALTSENTTLTARGGGGTRNGSGNTSSGNNNSNGPSNYELMKRYCGNARHYRYLSHNYSPEEVAVYFTLSPNCRSHYKLHSGSFLFRISPMAGFLFSVLADSPHYVIDVNGHALGDQAIWDWLVETMFGVNWVSVRNYCILSHRTKFAASLCSRRHPHRPHLTLKVSERAITRLIDHNLRGQGLELPARDMEIARPMEMGGNMTIYAGRKSRDLAVSPRDMAEDTEGGDDEIAGLQWLTGNALRNQTALLRSMLIAWLVDGVDSAKHVTWAKHPHIDRKVLSFMCVSMFNTPGCTQVYNTQPWPWRCGDFMLHMFGCTHSSFKRPPLNDALSKCPAVPRG